MTKGAHHHAQLISVFFFVGMVFRYIVQAGLELLSSGNPPASASQSARITGMSHRTWPFFFFVFLVEMGFHPVGQAGLKLLTSGDRLTSASKVLGLQA